MAFGKLLFLNNILLLLILQRGPLVIYDPDDPLGYLYDVDDGTRVSVSVIVAFVHIFGRNHYPESRRLVR